VAPRCGNPSLGRFLKSGVSSKILDDANFIQQKTGSDEFCALDPSSEAPKCEKAEFQGRAEVGSRAIVQSWTAQTTRRKLMNARIANQQKNWRGVIRIGENSVARKRITAERKKASKATYMRKYRKIKRAYVEKFGPLPSRCLLRVEDAKRSLDSGRDVWGAWRKYRRATIKNAVKRSRATRAKNDALSRSMSISGNSADCLEVGRMANAPTGRSRPAKTLMPYIEPTMRSSATSRFNLIIWGTKSTTPGYAAAFARVTMNWRPNEKPGTANRPNLWRRQWKPSVFQIGRN
jgi:hypothetical protein